MHSIPRYAHKKKNIERNPEDDLPLGCPNLTRPPNERITKATNPSEATAHAQKQETSDPLSNRTRHRFSPIDDNVGPPLMHRVPATVGRAPRIRYFSSRTQPSEDAAYFLGLRVALCCGRVALSPSSCLSSQPTWDADAALVVKTHTRKPHAHKISSSWESCIPAVYLRRYFDNKKGPERQRR